MTILNFKSKYLLFAFLLCSSVLWFGCPQPIDNDTPSTPKINTSFFGRIIDENGMGINSASVNVGNTTVTTNEHGVFKIANVSVNKNHTTVLVKKAGFFDGYRTIVAIENSSNSIEIMLIPKVLSGSFAATNGGIVNIGNDVSLSFTPNSIKTEGGSDYNGTVKIFASYLTPNDNNLLKKMPGDLVGEKTDGKEYILKTYGMVNVELYDDSGNKLNLKQGTNATISMNVPNNLSNAPSTIPLWYFNTETGIWKEEGTASQTNGKYVGQVSHFSWWNLDDPINGIRQVCFKLVTPNGQALGNFDFILKAEYANGESILRESRTDYDGNTCGNVPKNTIVRILLKNDCGLFLEIGTIPAGVIDNQDLGNIIVQYTNSNITTASGLLKTCNGNAVTDGYIIYYYNGNRHVVNVDNNGRYIISVDICYSNVNLSINAYDHTNNKFGFLNYTISASNTNIQDITVCEDRNDEYVNGTTCEPYTGNGSHTTNTYISNSGANVIVRPVSGGEELDVTSSDFHFKVVIPFDEINTGQIYEHNYMGTTAALRNFETSCLAFICDFSTGQGGGQFTNYAFQSGEYFIGEVSGGNNDVFINGLNPLEAFIKFKVKRP
jgi:hypothetical protein